MNDKYNEHELEMSIIQMFEEKGYTYIQENDDWIVNRKLDDFIIEDDLLESLEMINPKIKRKIFSEVVTKLKHLDALSFIDKNRLFHKYLVDGIFIDDEYRNLNTSNSFLRICYGECYEWNKRWEGIRLTNWTEVRDFLKLFSV